LNSTAPIRSRAAEEGNFQIPLWGGPLILALLYVCLFSGLGALGLVGPDEPRYAAIARAMAATNDWITPRLWGSPWFEKPVLYYWTAGVAMRIFGVGEFAARLPSALAALLAVVAVAWTALRSYGLGAAWYSLLMLPTCVALVGFSRAASTDMLFAGLLTATMAVALEMLLKPRPGPALRIAFGFFLGAAVLAKGPAAVILAGGATLAWAAITRQWRAPFRFLHPLVIAVFCSTALPWYVLCALRNPDFLRVFIWQHNFERYLTPIFEHRQPFYYYGYIVLLAVIPWVLLLLPASAALFKRIQAKGAPESIDIFFASWAVFPVVFFSVSQSKLPGYILPAIPPLFVLLARWTAAGIASNSRAVRLTLGWTGALLVVLGAVASGATLTAHRNSSLPPQYLLVALAVLLGGIVVTILAFRSRPATAVLCLALVVAGGVAIADFTVLPSLDTQISSRALATILAQKGVSADNVSIHELPRAWKYGLDYYFNRDLPEWAPDQGETQFIVNWRAFDPETKRRYNLDDVDLPDTNSRTVFLYRKR
jgi:4-amino-4-deoxy-L-arabinose transferase-like glycosyltransferase